MYWQRIIKKYGAGFVTWLNTNRKSVFGALSTGTVLQGITLVWLHLEKANKYLSSNYPLYCSVYPQYTPLYLGTYYLAAEKHLGVWGTYTKLTPPLFEFYFYQLFLWASYTPCGCWRGVILGTDFNLVPWFAVQNHLHGSCTEVNNNKLCHAIVRSRSSQHPWFLQQQFTWKQKNTHKIDWSILLVELEQT